MQCMHNMAKHERCTLSKLNGIEIPTCNYKVQVIFLSIKIKCGLTIQTMLWVGYAKLYLFLSHSIFNKLGDIQNTTKVQTT